MMINKWNIFLFEFNENSLKNIELTIIAHYYFPQVYHITKINEENRFYIDNYAYISIY